MNWMVNSFYDVLLLQPSATLDEIKSAFKKRALQVHPDKGGNKECFHRVYQAFEILADPIARRKYDLSLVEDDVTDVTEVKMMPRPKKTAKRSEPSKCQKARQARPSNPPFSHGAAHFATPSRSASRSATAQSSRSTSTFENLHSQQEMFLMKIHEILKGLPRELRQEVFQRDFSQQQRLVLEKWMTETLETPPKRAGETPIHSSVRALADGNVENQWCNNHSERTTDAKQDSEVSEAMVLRKSGVKRKRKASVMRGICTFASKNYGARIMLDQVILSTGESDLPTAVENLVILTSMKQKMLDWRSSPLSFEDSLLEAWVSSAREHGKTAEELGLRFKMVFTIFFFIGQNDVRSPTVHRIEDLRRIRQIMEPFHDNVRCRGGGRRGHLWQHSPMELELRWQRFQSGIIEMFQFAGKDAHGTQVLKRARHWYQLSAPRRRKLLQFWEAQHMGMNEKNQYRPRRWRLKRSLPHSLQNVEEMVKRKVISLRRLLLRWDRVLKTEARLVAKVRREKLRRQQNAQKERRRAARAAAAAWRKRLEAAKLRRQAQQQRCK